MANIKQGNLTPAPEHWKHLGAEKRTFWKAERAAGNDLIAEEKAAIELNPQVPDFHPDDFIIQESGYWKADKTSDGRVFVESDDTHDVRHYVDGDFAHPLQKMAYATEIARRLNAVEKENHQSRTSAYKKDTL